MNSMMKLIVSVGIKMFKEYPFKTGVPYTVHHNFSKWNDLRLYYEKTLDRIDGQIQWTKEAIDSLNYLADTMVEQINKSIAEVMKLFTQSEITISQGYLAMLRAFKPTEVFAMLADFMAREVVHIENYSLFTETIGLPDSTYTDFLDVPIMATKTEYLDKARVRKYEDYKALGLTNTQIDRTYKRDLARMVAVYAAFGEGVTLMANFASLQAYQFQNKYPGLCDINRFSITEETLHNKGNSELFRVFISENPEIWDDELKFEIYEACRETVAYEHALIDYLNPPHMSKDDLKQYVCYCADNALKELGMKANWGVNKNPLPFMDDVVGQVQTDFFSGRETSYTRQVQGEWGDLNYDRWKQ
jgi:ribonucleoside-diphosphate reductase beta chain